MKETQDALGQKTTRGYDDHGRLASITRPDNTKLLFGYDIAGHLTSVTLRPGSVHKFGHDAAGRQTSHENPKGSVFKTAYDPAGNTIESTDPDATGPITIAFTYDALHRPLTIRSPEGLQTFSYDDAVNSVTVSLPDGSTIQRFFDGNDRPIKEIADGHTVEWAYDGAGNIGRVHLDGLVVLRYAYSLRDRVTVILDVRTNRTVKIRYDPANRPAEMTLTNGMRKLTTYGPRGEVRTERILDPQGRSVQFRAYTYDPNLHLRQVDDEQGVLETYQYDSRQRIALATYRGGGFETWGYDDNSNVTRYRSNLVDLSPRYNAADELLSVAGTSPSSAEHDLRGNLTKLTGPQRVEEYRWDSQRRLVEYKLNGVVVARYGYRDDGLRRAVEFPVGQSTTTLWSLGNPQALLDPAGFLKTFFLTGLGLDEVYEGSSGASPMTSAEVPLVDHLGSVLAVVDLSGNVIRRSDYLTYGDLRAGSPPGGLLPFGHHGALFDPASGLYNHRARWRHPGLMRWMSRDPSGLRADPNPYSFSSSNPTDVTDPTGLRGRVRLSEAELLRIERLVDELFPRTRPPRRGPTLYRDVEDQIEGALRWQWNPENPSQGIDWPGFGFPGPTQAGVSTTVCQLRPAGSPFASVLSDIPGYLAAIDVRHTQAMPGVTLFSYPPAPQAGEIALDTNVMVYAIEGHQEGRLIVALAGRRPVVSPTAIDEFLAKGDKLLLAAFLYRRGARIGPPGDAALAQNLQARAAAPWPPGSIRVNDGLIYSGAAPFERRWFHGVEPFLGKSAHELRSQPWYV